MTHNGAQILQKLLVDLTLTNFPGEAGGWPITYGTTDQDIQDDWLTVVSVAGWKEGKIMRGGDSTIKPRVQIQGRSMSHGTAENKLNAILEVLSPLTQQVITVSDPLPSATYLLHAVTIIIPTAWLKAEEKNQREVYVATVQLSIEET